MYGIAYKNIFNFILLEWIHKRIQEKIKHNSLNNIVDYWSMKYQNNIQSIIRTTKFLSTNLFLSFVISCTIMLYYIYIYISIYIYSIISSKFIFNFILQFSMVVWLSAQIDYSHPLRDRLMRIINVPLYLTNLLKF
jgi:hypothetical protein